MRERAAQAATTEMARLGVEAPSTPLLSALPMPTPTSRFFGAVAVAAAVFYYAGTSEVAWLYLLAYLVTGLIVAAYAYALWNRGLRGEVYVRGYSHADGSPAKELPEAVLMTCPPQRAFEGDSIAVDLRLVSSRGTRGPARLTGTIAGQDVAAAAGLVPKGGWSEQRVVGPARRGPFITAGWVLDSGDLLGLFRDRCTKPEEGEIALVLPRFTSLVARPRVRELEASTAAPRSGSGTELFGVREYRPGDPLRRIHWRSSARHGELIVREYEPPGVQSLGIFCDPAPASAEVADQIARLAASEAWDCVRSGGRVVLWSPGAEPTRPDESGSLWALLEWLARYPQQGAGDQNPPPPPHVSDVVAVVAGGSDDVVDAVEGVKRRGGGVRAWVVGDAQLEVDAPVQRVGLDWPL